MEICEYLIDIDCDYIVMCMVDICKKIYSLDADIPNTSINNTTGDRFLGLPFLVDCLKILNKYNHIVFFVLLHEVYDNYDRKDIIENINDDDFVYKVNTYLTKNYETIDIVPEFPKFYY